MGDLIKMVCRGCGHEWHCRTGCGIHHAKLDAVIDFFGQDTQQKIQKLTMGKDFPLFTFGYQPAYCEQCHDIVSVPVITFPKEKAEYIGECPKCQTAISAGQLNENLMCPICQSSEFTKQREGSWD